MQKLTLEPRDLRNALGCFATGVTVVTSVGPHGELLGNTVNSFTSVSLDPPLILWCMGRHTKSLDGYLSTDHFAVNVLAADQSELSARFSIAGTNKWTDVTYATGQYGCPILSGTVAVFECTTRHTYLGGDHVIFVGEVMSAAANRGREPLVFLHGEYRQVQSLAEPAAT